MTTTANATYANLINLLAVFSEGKARLAELEAQNNADYLELVDARKAEYAELQLQTSEAEGAIIAIATEHPEWFPERQRTLKTPYGAVAAHKATRHETDDEAAVIECIESAISNCLAVGALDKVAMLEPLLRVEKSLDLEAFGRLDDGLVLELGVRRVTSDSITVKEAKMSLGNAVKAAAKKSRKEVPA